MKITTEYKNAQLSSGGGGCYQQIRQNRVTFFVRACFFFSQFCVLCVLFCFVVFCFALLCFALSKISRTSCSLYIFIVCTLLRCLAFPFFFCFFPNLLTTRGTIYPQKQKDNNNSTRNS